jgi:hypothetical protein
MQRLFLCSCVLCVTASVGCGGSREEKKDAPQEARDPERMTLDNVARIRNQELNYTGVVQVFAKPGEPTNEDKPGLMPGNRYVWREGNKKVYVSFNPINGKANGVAWEGFGGR